MKLLLADDHTLFRDALVLYIERAEPSSAVVLAKNLHEAIEKIEEDSDLDLVLLDLRMPGMNGLEGLRQIRDQYPDLPVALMSGVAEQKDVETAMDLGAVGYFPKTLSGKDLLKAIRHVLGGEKFVPTEGGSDTVMPSYYADPQDKKNTPYGGMAQTQAPLSGVSNLNLTPREQEVLSFLARGASNKEIASELDLQVVTVKLHVRGVCRKLGAKNRTQAALKARELGVSSK